MPNFYFMFHGLPGSGKSTAADHLAELLDSAGLKCSRANRDNIRTEIAGESYHSSVPVYEVEMAVNRVIEQIMGHAVKNDLSILDDNTNLDPRRIAELREKLAGSGFIIVHLPVDVSVDVAKERNTLRGNAGGRRVPDAVIDSMAAKSYTSDLSGLDIQRLASENELVIGAFSSGNFHEVTLDDLFKSSIS